MKSLKKLLASRKKARQSCPLAESPPPAYLPSLTPPFYNAHLYRSANLVLIASNPNDPVAPVYCLRFVVYLQEYPSGMDWPHYDAYLQITRYTPHPFSDLYQETERYIPHPSRAVSTHMWRCIQTRIQEKADNDLHNWDMFPNNSLNIVRRSFVGYAAVLGTLPWETAYSRKSQEP